MEIALRATDNMVLLHGDGIACPTGCTLLTLTDAQEAAFEALQPPAGCPGVTFDGTTFTALPVPPPSPPPDPLKPYRDALSTAAANDPGLDSSTKTALSNLLTAMAPH